MLKNVFFICQNLSSVSDYPLKLSNVSHTEFFLQRHRPGKQQRHVHNMHKATFGTWRDNLCSSESSEEKYTLLWILFGLKKSTEYKYYSVWKITRIRIRILFGLKNSPEYEYEYYLVWKSQPNTNANTNVGPQLF